MNLLHTAFYFFALVAAGGLTIAVLIGARVQFPGLLPIGHGAAGFAALIFLLVTLMRTLETSGSAWWALAVFTAGFLGGVLMVWLKFPKNPPLLLIAGHGIVAGIGLYLLWAASF
jgi:hypothetical protein